MKIELIKRNKSVLIDDELEHLYTFENFPIFMGCTDKLLIDDIKVDMSWSICKKTGIIQLDNLIPMEILYFESHESGCVGELWNSHHIYFSNFIQKFNIDSVLEIGGSHGILSKEYYKTKKIPWTILEPNPPIINNSEIRFIEGFFNEKFKYDHDFDAIIHSHLFEHIFDPNLFMSYFSKLMTDDKYLIFSIPNMNRMLEFKYTNCLNFEHTIFLIEPYIEYLLSKYGFRLIEKEYFMTDHSIFYAAIRDSSVELIDLPNFYEKNKKLFLNYLEYHKKLVKDINDKIENSDREVYLFGAHIFSQYLLSFGLKTNKIISILDNNVNKQNRRLYGTDLYVNSPKILKDKNHPIVILRAGLFNDEIKKDIINNINNTVEFIE